MTQRYYEWSLTTNCIAIMRGPSKQKVLRHVREVVKTIGKVTFGFETVRTSLVFLERDSKGTRPCSDGIERTYTQYQVELLLSDEEAAIFKLKFI